MRYFCSPNSKDRASDAPYCRAAERSEGCESCEKGSVPGVYVQETTGEPGSMQNMLFRGVSTPIFSKGDVASTQPVVFLNGIPLLMNDAFVYNVKSTEVNPIGTATNILSGLNLDNVASIEVVKDAAQLAKLGPLLHPSVPYRA